MTAQFSYVKRGDTGSFWCRHCYTYSHDAQTRLHDIECPACGGVSVRHTIVVVDNGLLPSKRLAQSELKIKEKGNKVQLVSLFKEVHISPNNKIFHKIVVGLSVFNTQTGQSYEICPVYAHNRKPFRADKRYSPPPIRNISWGGGHDYSPVLTIVHGEDLLNLSSILKDKLSEKFGKEVPSLEEYCRANNEEPCTQFVVARYVRQPWMNPFWLGDVVSSLYCGDWRKSLALLRKIKHDSFNPIDDLLSAFGEKDPKPSLIRALRKNPSVLGCIPALSVFKNTDHKLTLMNLFQSVGFQGEEVRPFLKAMLSLTTESIVVKKIKQGGYGVSLYDAARMYNECIFRNPSYTFPVKGMSLREIHDHIMADYNKLRNANINLHYTKKEVLFEMQINDLHFRLPKDTHELADVGREMNICVGSYAQRCLDKSLGIVVAYNKDNLPVLCIELDKQFKTVVQAKEKHNRRPAGETLGNLLTWITEKDLRVDTRDISIEEAV